MTYTYLSYLNQVDHPLMIPTVLTSSLEFWTIFWGEVIASFFPKRQPCFENTTTLGWRKKWWCKYACFFLQIPPGSITILKKKTKLEILRDSLILTRCSSCDSCRFYCKCIFLVGLFDRCFHQNSSGFPWSKELTTGQLSMHENSILILVDEHTLCLMLYL